MTILWIILPAGATEASQSRVSSAIKPLSGRMVFTDRHFNRRSVVPDCRSLYQD